LAAQARSGNGSTPGGKHVKVHKSFENRRKRTWRRLISYKRIKNEPSDRTDLDAWIYCSMSIPNWMQSIESNEYMLQTPQPFLVTFLHIMQPFIKILFTWIHIYVQTAIACILILFDIDCFQNHLCNIFFTRMNTWRQTIIASFHTSATLACMFVWNRLFPKPFMQTTHERIEIKNMRTSGNRSPSLNKTGPRFLASWKISTLLIIQYILYMNDWMNICCKLRNHLW